jgi:hypothetical protein
MRRAALLLPPLVLLAIPCVAVRADPPAEGARAAQVAALVHDLADLATWCQKGRLFAARNEVCELILAFDPDHATARRWLRYRRGADGGWTRRPHYHAPHDMVVRGPEFGRRLGALRTRFADRTLAWIADAGRGPAARARALRQALRLAPGRRDLHEAAGEVPGPDGTWLLAETPASRTRRTALQAAARRALASVPEPRRDRPTAEENATRLPFTVFFEGPRVRVGGTVPEDELREAYRRAAACFGLFEAAFPGAVPQVRRLEILLLQTAGERDQLLDQHPRSRDDFRSWGRKLQSAWIPGTSVVFAWNPKRTGRLEWCSRQVLGALLRNGFGVRSRNGWAFEGFGLRLSHLLCGRRTTFFVRRSTYGEKGAHAGDLWDKLKAERARWRPQARTLLDSDRAPDLRLLLGKGVNTMDTEDLLVSYVLAAYALEARPDRAAAWLRAVGRGRPWAEALEAGLGLDAEGLRVRVRRWLQETAGS